MEGELGFCKTDCDSVLAHINQQQELLLLKRRWLLGLPLSKSDEKKLAQARTSCLPESFLRDDDVFCESVTQRVEKAFNAHKAEVEDRSQQTVHVLDRRVIEIILSSGLDALTNEGLHRVALLLTGGTVDFLKTRKKMKEVIKGSLFEALQHEHCGVDFVNEVSILLNNPRNARKGHLSFFIPAYSHRATAIRVLSELEEIPTEALLAMHKKLRSSPTGTPSSQKTRYGWSRDTLIHTIRKKSEKMMSNASGRDQLPVPLAKALAIASLSSMLLGRPISSVTDFDQFSPATRTLQNEIANAILQVKTMVRLPELKDILLLLDPNSDVSNGSLRTSVKKMLMDYLFECSDMDKVPKSLLEALGIINRGSRVNRSSSFEEEIVKEVDCILTLSAHTKQIVWDLLSDVDFHGDFSDAYVEELVESEEEDEVEDGCGNHPTVSDVTNIDTDDDSDKKPEVGSFWNEKISDNQEVSTGENILLEPDQLSIDLPAESCGVPSILGVVPAAESIHGATITGKKMSNENLNDTDEAEKYTEPESNSPYLQQFCKTSYEFFQQSVCSNLYLGIQDACDDTSMSAYNLIGRIIEGLAHEEGVDLDHGLRSYLRGDCSDQEHQGQDSAGSNNTESVIIRAAKNLLPALSKSRMDVFKEMLGVP